MWCRGGLMGLQGPTSMHVTRAIRHAWLTAAHNLAQVSQTVGA